MYRLTATCCPCFNIARYSCHQCTVDSWYSTVSDVYNDFSGFGYSNWACLVLITVICIGIYCVWIKPIIKWLSCFSHLQNIQILTPARLSSTTSLILWHRNKFKHWSKVATEDRRLKHGQRTASTHWKLGHAWLRQL